MYIIRCKPGNRKLYISIDKGIMVELPEATRFTPEQIIKWVDDNKDEDPWAYTFIDINTGKEFSYPDGPPSSPD